MLMFWGDETVFSVPSDVVELSPPPSVLSGRLVSFPSSCCFGFCTMLQLPVRGAKPAHHFRIVSHFHFRFTLSHSLTLGFFETFHFLMQFFKSCICGKFFQKQNKEHPDESWSHACKVCPVGGTRGKVTESLKSEGFVLQSQFKGDFSVLTSVNSTL